jgi:alkanesulfonate monooxygenase SsuD/methylene tetrahydromethanopterin reductase-like flavin-dependent oxidoreductase (luciferase family)
MRIGHLFVQPSRDVNYDHAQRLSECIELVQLVDELGFDAAVFGENHFTNYGFSPNPVLLAAAIGQHTNNIDLGTGVTVLPFWQPLRLAEDIATADQLLKGRFHAIIGRGYQQIEYGGLNIPYAERQRRYDEVLEILLLAWQGKEFTYEGEYYRVPRPVRVIPDTYTKPHPTIWVAGVTEESIRAAARTEFSVFGSQMIATKSAGSTKVTDAQGRGGAFSGGQEIYLDERRRRGLDDGHWRNAMNRQIFVVDTTNPTEYGAERLEALNRSREALRLAQHLREGTHGYDNGQITAAPLADEPGLEGFSDRMIFGNPGEVLEQVRYLRDEQGVTDITIFSEFGYVDHKKTRRSLELFGREVLPALREDEAGAQRSSESRVSP